MKTKARRPGPREEGLGASCPFKPQLPARLAVPSPAPLVAPPGGRTSAAARRPGRWALPPPRPRPASRRRRVRLRRRGRALADGLGAHVRGAGLAWARAGRGAGGTGSRWQSDSVASRKVGPPVHARRPRWKRTVGRPRGLASGPGRVSHQAPPFRPGPERCSDPLRGRPERDTEQKALGKPRLIPNRAVEERESKKP